MGVSVPIWSIFCTWTHRPLAIRPKPAGVDWDGPINAGNVLIATQSVLRQRIPRIMQYAHGDMNLGVTIDLADLLLIQ